MQATNAERKLIPAICYEEIDRSARSYIRQRVTKLVGKLGFTISDCEDIEQEIVISLHQLLRLYDPARGSVEQFINKVMTSRIRNIVRQRVAHKRDFRKIAFSLDSTLHEEDDGLVGSSIDALNVAGARGGQIEAGSYTQDQLDLKIAVDQAMEKLPPHLVRLCEALKRGNVSSAARELGISRRSVMRQIDMIQSLFDIWLPLDEV
ncbi:MAG: sigma factor [Armatimonadota bacterium]